MSKYWRYPATVLGCLRNGEITVILCAGIGLADGGKRAQLPIHIIPLDLRMPNSKFDVLLERASGSFVKVLRKDEIYLNCD
ncbi:hypothetical protein [Calothrix sp. UHCC 0171]|uniref:hypothetical protein n=1 Tax=Calothrix sp. UHCC 0171 TaxID=3110245 RepID=UPI002B221521|nr:hypothetical protein [Calothrix sp. UHCC 0171]MEA5570495.1 hypothetical protein [Calothrix sp. UHCC 0171]